MNPGWADLDWGLFSISVAAELAGLHPQTLRIYEREGLLASARAGLAALVSSGVGPGVLRPAEILLPAGAPVPAPGGRITVVSPPAWAHDGQRIAEAWSPADPSTADGKAALRAIRAAAEVPGARAGGSPAPDADFITALYGRNLAVIIAAS